MQADEVIANAFRTYDPSGTVELEDREKLVLMRNYIRDYHAKMQTTIALWQSENAERMAGDMIAGDMTAYFTLSQRVTAYRKPIGGVEGGEGLDYPPQGAERAVDARGLRLGCALHTRLPRALRAGEVDEQQRGLRPLRPAHVA